MGKYEDAMDYLKRLSTKTNNPLLITIPADIIITITIFIIAFIFSLFIVFRFIPSQGIMRVITITTVQSPMKKADHKVREGLTTDPMLPPKFGNHIFHHISTF